MKKVFFTTVLIFGVIFASNSQTISKNAIGLRLGDNDGFGTELNYQRAIGDNNRLEFGLGWRSNRNLSAFKLTGLHQWVWNIDGGFNWYAGVGGGVGSIDFDDDRFGPDFDNETFVFVAGDIGIEYNFDIPLLISLDFRPELGFGNYRDDLGFDVGLGLRYQF
jgi:opacity protein-like surface antigen